MLENENGLYYYNRMGDVIPNPELAALRSMPNVILTDHTAFYTYEDGRAWYAACWKAPPPLPKARPLGMM
ncbi:MAG: hypothetical protein ACLVJH_15950 [Faecalibacterium prausnitzii]